MLLLMIHFLTLILLMLVTGIFWGPWFSLHRSMHVFNEAEFIHIVKTLSANLARPMRVMMSLCLLCMGAAVWTYPHKASAGFYLSVAAFLLLTISLIITVLVEVPIVSQINQWTITSLPGNWKQLRDRWLKFHVLRTFAALAGFACFVASVLFLQTL